MNKVPAPTRGNLLLAKNTLRLSQQGYELLDKKRNILIQELMGLIEAAKGIQGEIDDAFAKAYAALRRSNIAVGSERVEAVSRAVSLDNVVNIKTRSIMGVEIPVVTSEKAASGPPFSFYTTTPSLDIAYKKFLAAKELSLRLAQIENTAYRLAWSITKTQKRANALKNIIIPRYTFIVGHIQNFLEEKEREEFARLKAIKKKREG